MTASKKMTARSAKMTSGLEKAPHRSLLAALGLTREEMRRPLIGIANSANEIIPGHIHLDKIVQAVKDGVRVAGGTPMKGIFASSAITAPPCVRAEGAPSASIVEA